MDAKEHIREYYGEKSVDDIDGNAFDFHEYVEKKLREKSFKDLEKDLLDLESEREEIRLAREKEISRSYPKFIASVDMVEKVEKLCIEIQKEKDRMNILSGKMKKSRFGEISESTSKKRAELEELYEERELILEHYPALKVYGEITEALTKRMYSQAVDLYIGLLKYISEKDSPEQYMELKNECLRQIEKAKRSLYEDFLGSSTSSRMENYGKALLEMGVDPQELAKDYGI